MERHIVTSLVVIAATIMQFYFPDHRGLGIGIAANLYWIWRG